ncbi:mucin-5AC-like isoform X1 [Helicoverpa zea]|uniref:mucin-5AC-like isoform X1 n=1 Tax=Helicoverpa zea TaxID=7113 RepID=UPI001F56E77A|nr:mucin-5AC-like isoform X1 [Helicoverpa zea]
MRKTSQDGGDSSSITSGIENEIKKSGAIIKTKRNSIKRKVQNFSHESDDAVIEPLLQKDKEKTETIKPQSAKFNLLTKTKTDTDGKGSDKDKLITDKSSGLSDTSDIKDRVVESSNVKDNSVSKFTSSNAPIHNHMNTNVFNSHDGLKGYVAPKSQILVEIDNSRQVGYNPSPLIFTTAKIHTDGKTKQMEPVQMTPVPILSTIEVSVIKSGINTGETSGQVSSNISTGYSTISHNAKPITEQIMKPLLNTLQNKEIDSKILISTEKKTVTTNAPDKISLSSLSNKESTLTQPKSITTSSKDNATENKNTSKKDQSGTECPPKTSGSQPANSISSNKIKTTLPQVLQIGAVALSTTKVTSANNNGKSEVIEQPLTIMSDKSPRYPVKKSDLNKIVKPDSQKTDACGSVKSEDKASADKDYNNTSFNNKQLQRQSVVNDKDGTMPKLKSNMVTSPQSNEGMSLNKSGEKSISNEADEIGDKTKLPKHSANNVPTTIITTLPISANTADNKIPASLTTSSTASKKLTQTTSSVPVSKIHNVDLRKSLTDDLYCAVTCSKTSVATTANSTTSKTVAPTKTTSVNNPPAIGIQVTTTQTNTATATIKTTSVTVPKTVKESSTSINAPNAAKTSVLMSTTVTSAPSTTIAAGNKISAPISTVVTTSKLSDDVVTAPATKIPSKTTGAIADKISTPSVAMNSSDNPLTSSSSSKICTPITKVGTVTPTTVSKPLNTENKSGSASSSVHVKTTNDGSREKPQGTGTLITKPTSSAISTKSAKVSTMVTPTTNSQRTMMTKPQTTAKTTATKTTSQSSEITPMSSSSKEKSSVAKNSTTSISSTTSGKSAAPNSTLVSSGSSSKSTDTSKRNDSKSKELSNGNKSLKA